MFDGSFKYKTMLERVHQTQLQFYSTTTDDFRVVSDTNLGSMNDQNTNASANESVHTHDSEEVYLKEVCEANKLAKTERKLSKHKNRVPIQTVLYGRAKSRVNAQVLKESKIIKDFCRQEFNNQMFDKVFAAVCHPETIKHQKEDIQKMLHSELQKTKRFSRSSRRPLTSRPQSVS